MHTRTWMNLKIMFSKKIRQKEHKLMSPSIQSSRKSKLIQKDRKQLVATWKQKEGWFAKGHKKP